MDSIGKRITYLREKKKLTQRGLAQFVNVSHTTISRLEKDNIKPSIDTIDKLANFFETTSDYILYGTNYNSSQLQGTIEYLELISLIDTLTRDELIMLKGIIIGIKKGQINNHL